MALIETWVVAFNDDAYEVSDLGRVRRDGRVLKPWKNSRGYLLVDLRNRVKVRVHRLVWQSFHGCCGDLVVDHKNNQKTDNRLENLRAVSQEENIQLALASGRFIGRAKRSGWKHTTEDERTAWRDLHAKGASKAEVVRISGRSKSLIEKILG